MSLKWIGAILIITGCGGCGFSIAAGSKREEKLLQQLISVLQFMESELQYRLTPLPELCRLAGKEINGPLREVLQNLSGELSRQCEPDALRCMSATLKISCDLPARLRKHLLQLGRCLGRFDLAGQIRGMHGVRAACEEDLRVLRKNQDVRLRSYRTLGFCAGTALVILFV